MTERLKRLRGYRWSSYRAYAGYAAAPQWLETAELLGRAHRVAARRQAVYRADVRQRLTRGFAAADGERWRDAAALGSTAFARRVRAWAAGQDWRGVTGTRALRRRIPAAAVRAAVERLKGKAWEAFGQQYGDSGCALFLWAARRLCGLTLRELGVAAGAGKGGAASMSVSAVSKTIRRLEQRALRDKSLRTLQSRILEMSNVQP